jgi:hypothetical protein
MVRIRRHCLRFLSDRSLDGSTCRTQFRPLHDFGLRVGGASYIVSNIVYLRFARQSLHGQDETEQVQWRELNISGEGCPNVTDSLDVIQT